MRCREGNRFGLPDLLVNVVGSRMNGTEMMIADEVKAYLTGLQTRLVAELRRLDGQASCRVDDWQRAAGGGGRSIVLEGGELIEKGGVNFSHVTGDSLPAAATQRRPELRDAPFAAMGVSVVLHPSNPHVPCCHMNVRFFATRGEPSVWWFGGGFDLTPVYPVLADVVAWHAAARAACVPFGEGIYADFKTACDRYFYLPHRGETRGVGGLFFDDWNQPDAPTAFALTRSIGDAFLPAWSGIAQLRREQIYTPEQKAFQCYRRGRYVEFNLLYDRGTLFGLQSGGRTESILMSLPPQAAWRYDFVPEPGTPEARLSEYYLQPRDWLSESLQESP